MIEGEYDWKAQLMQHCHAAISKLPDDGLISDAGEEASEMPSLYDFYAELLAMRNEMRKVNRRTVETFGSFGEVLDGMRSDGSKLRERLLEQPDQGEKSSGVSRNLALSMVDLLDRVHRLEKTAIHHSQKGWSGVFCAKEYAENQSGAISILSDHLHKLLVKSEVQPIRVRAGDPYDPLCMKAVGRVESSNNDGDNSASQLVVAEQSLAGYHMGEHCLRPAEVSLTELK